MKIKNVKSIALKAGAILLVLVILGSTAVLFGSSGSSSPGNYKPPHQEVTVSSQYEKGGGTYYRDSAKFITTAVSGDNTLCDTISELKVVKKDGNVLIGNNGYTVNNPTGWIDVIDYDNNKVLSVGKLDYEASIRADFLATVNTGSYYVFEADFMWLGTGGLSTTDESYNSRTREHLIFSFNASDNGTVDSFVMFYGTTNKSESDKLYISLNNEATSTAVISKGEWVNLRAVYTVLDETSGSIVLYLNNELVDQAIVACSSNALFETFTIQINRLLTDTSFLLDNVYVSAIK